MLPFDPELTVIASKIIQEIEQIEGICLVKEDRLTEEEIRTIIVSETRNGAVGK